MQEKKMSKMKAVDLLCWNYGDQFIDELRNLAADLKIIEQPHNYEDLNFEELDAEFDLVADCGFQEKALEFFKEHGL